jgi:hypothetical protein
LHGFSNRKNRFKAEWERRVWDVYRIDVVNPAYCRGSAEEIETMHGRVSNARLFIRRYVERPIHYSENIVTESDPRYLAKTIDFAVAYFEESNNDEGL